MSKKTKATEVEPNNELHTVTGRFNDQLFKRMQEWLKKNGISTNQLLARAVDNYISEPQVLEPVTVEYASDENTRRAMKKMMIEHKRALDELK